SAHVELVSAVQDHTAILEEFRQYSVGDCRADLRLNVVSDDGQSCFSEFICPLLRAGDQYGKSIDESDASIKASLSVELGGVLRANGQVAHQNVGLRISQCLGYVNSLSI